MIMFTPAPLHQTLTLTEFATLTLFCAKDFMEWPNLRKTLTIASIWRIDASIHPEKRCKSYSK